MANPAQKAAKKPAKQPANRGVMYAVVGYVADDVAKSLDSGGLGGRALELRVDQGKDQEIIRIQPDDIAGVLQGASRAGETSVQVLLKDRANVETVSRGLASDLFLRPIGDASLVFKRPPLNVIYVDPQFTQRLTDLVRNR